MIISKFDPSTNVLYSKFSGSITYDDLFDHFQKLGTNNKLPSELFYFEDHTEAEYTFKPIEIKKLVRLLSNCIMQFNHVRAAILHSKPKETAYSIIALQHINFPNIQAFVFSTKEAAHEWLMSENNT